MRTVDLIRHKRDGGRLDRPAIAHIVAGAVDGSIPDYQIAAWLMAVVLRGMTPDETADLTAAMVSSGVRLTFEGLAATPVDKHSTGGVGDKTSLVIAPLVAACGGIVPMMSGRGLGHTGGTLDKLEAIPGFRTALSLEEIGRAVAEVGAALVGQTAEIAPADRRLYALRDVTATVESVPLISASIMSKKIAEGAGALVLDVKTGAGAFMETERASRELAESLVRIGRAAGLAIEALITRMDAPLGRAVGHTTEVVESLETLKGRGPEDLVELSIRLSARMLVLSGVAGSDHEAARRVSEALASGAGLEAFRRIVARQGGDPSVVDDYARLPWAPAEHQVRAPRNGVVHAIHARHVGRALASLGGGRATLTDAIDHGVGVTVVAPPGVEVRAGDTVLVVRHRDGRGLDDAVRLLEEALVIDEEPFSVPPLVVDVVA